METVHLDLAYSLFQPLWVMCNPPLKLEDRPRLNLI